MAKPTKQIAKPNNALAANLGSHNASPRLLITKVGDFALNRENMPSSKVRLKGTANMPKNSWDVKNVSH
ncbi:MAG: hypothetical protein AAB680_05935, partial [Pseudomonadota bacterium]